MKWRERISERAFLEACADAYRWRKQAERLKRALQNAECAHCDELLEWKRRYETACDANERLMGQVLRLETEAELRKMWH